MPQSAPVLLLRDDAPAPFDAAGTPDRAALALLRVVGARCRGMARSDLFRACAMLSTDQTRAAEAVATALLRGFSGMGDVPRLQLYQPTSAEVSFDEAWLLAALAAARRDDRDSLTFLLARRLPKHMRRQVGFLIVALDAALARRPLAV